MKEYKNFEEMYKALRTPTVEIEPKKVETEEKPKKKPAKKKEK